MNFDNVEKLDGGFAEATEMDDSYGRIDTNKKLRRTRVWMMEWKRGVFAKPKFWNLKPIEVRLEEDNVFLKKKLESFIFKEEDNPNSEL